MGVDSTVTFATQPFALEQILRTSAIQARRFRTLLIALGQPQPDSLGLHFMAIWVSGEVDMLEICAELSVQASPLCFVWKYDHASTSGYIHVQDGTIVQEAEYDPEQADASAAYDELPILGLASVFPAVAARPLDADFGMCFPECLFDKALDCFDCSRPEEPIRIAMAELHARLHQDSSIDPALW